MKIRLNFLRWIYLENYVKQLLKQSPRIVLKKVFCNSGKNIWKNSLKQNLVFSSCSPATFWNLAPSQVFFMILKNKNPKQRNLFAAVDLIHYITGLLIILHMKHLSLQVFDEFSKGHFIIKKFNQKSWGTVLKMISSAVSVLDEGKTLSDWSVSSEDVAKMIKKVL